MQPILVVEDNEDTRQALTVLLNLEGYPVVGAEDGLEGLRTLLQHRPSLVLLDLTMPVVDGWEFRDEQRALPDPALASTPVLLVTALADAQRHADELGAVGFIQKPIDIDRLLETVRRYCGDPGEPSEGSPPAS